MLFFSCPFFSPSVLGLIKGRNFFLSDCAKGTSAETNHALLLCMFSDHEKVCMVRRKKEEGD